MVTRAQDALARTSATVRAGLRHPILAVPALAAGIVASLAATLLMLALRQLAGIVTLPELLGERILPHLDTGTFVRLLVQFGKLQPLGAALIGQIVLGALVALVYVVALGERGLARSPWPGRREWSAAAALSAALWLIAVALFWPVLPENLLGYPVGQSRAVTVLGLAGIFALYGLVLAIVYHALTVQSAHHSAVGTAASPDRRRLLARAALVAVGGLAVGSLGLDVLVQTLLARSTLGYDGMSTPALAGGTVAPITPTAEFYLVTKNVIDPQVVLGDWALDVTGLVGRPGRYDLATLQALPQVTRVVTLECISNQVDGHLISTAQWRGVTLQTLLADRGGAIPAGTHILFTGADGYQSAQTLDELLRSDALIVWEMNGAPLTSRHGYPLRVIVPGYYGEHSPKWLTEVAVVEGQPEGFYQQQGWYWGPVHTISRIDVPAPHARLAAGPVHVTGIAYAGTRGIAAVDVSTDGGQIWTRATLSPALSSQSWVLWGWEWMAAPGTYTLVARATDGAGGVQSSVTQGTTPNGAEGYQWVPVTVR
jgi:DMSO/TMAO reductase YedYZ molybdopterin-dependent catalytic subunit